MLVIWKMVGGKEKIQLHSSLPSFIFCSSVLFWHLWASHVYNQPWHIKLQWDSVPLLLFKTGWSISVGGRVPKAGKSIKDSSSSHCYKSHKKTNLHNCNICRGPQVNSIQLSKCIIVIVYLPVDCYLYCFHFLDVVNRKAINRDGQVSL